MKSVWYDPALDLIVVVEWCEIGIWAAYRYTGLNFRIKHIISPRELGLIYIGEV